MTAARSPALFVSQERLWQRHLEMARIGAIPGGGVNRAALSPEDREARRLLASWAGARGFTLAQDDMANLWVRRQGQRRDDAPVLTGSHMDTQPLGGRFDGIYGVLAGLEVLEALEDAEVETRRPVEVVAWTNEEGGRFAPGAMGSMVFSGARRLEEFLDVRDTAGECLKEALDQTLASLPEAARRPLNAPAAAYVEAHIEQGPILDTAGLSVGVVTGIQGCRWFEVQVSGESSHAGTTPAWARHDALQDALAAINALNALMGETDDSLRFTVGRLEVQPNTPNSVPAEVTFSVDLRHPEGAVLERLGDGVERVCRESMRRCTVRVRETFRHPPCVFDSTVVAAIEDAARSLDIAYKTMRSGAFHDALFMAAVCPTGMIFAPCERGISHNPAENADPEHLAQATRVLAETVSALAGHTP